MHTNGTTFSDSASENLASSQVIGQTQKNLETIELPVLSTSKISAVSFGSTIALKTFHVTSKWCHDTTDAIDSIKVKGRLPMLVIDLEALNLNSTMLSRKILAGLLIFLSTRLLSS